ncbi:MAG: GTP-binding protein [Gelidibacter sp.]
MPTANEIVLRPRFKMELNHPNEEVLKALDEAKCIQSDFILSRVGDHVFIRLPKHKQHFWSPQLHLEVNEIDSKSCMLHGLFGPNPTVWTMFMFVHFFVAGMFITFGIWSYTNWRLGNSYGIQIGLMILMVLVWIGLYLAGRLGRSKGKPEMYLLHNFMSETLRSNRLV